MEGILLHLLWGLRVCFEAIWLVSFQNLLPPLSCPLLKFTTHLHYPVLSLSMPPIPTIRSSPKACHPSPLSGPLLKLATYNIRFTTLFILYDYTYPVVTMYNIKTQKHIQFYRKMFLFFSAARMSNLKTKSIWTLFEVIFFYCFIKTAWRFWC